MCGLAAYALPRYIQNREIKTYKNGQTRPIRSCSAHNYLFLTVFSAFLFGPLFLFMFMILTVPLLLYFFLLAGVIGRIVANLGEYEHKINKRTGHPESIFIFFEMEVERIEERWPEMKKRERRWVRFLWMFFFVCLIYQREDLFCSF